MCRNIDSHKQTSLFTVVYTDLLLNQFNVRPEFDKLIEELGFSNEECNFLIVCDEITNGSLRAKLGSSSSSSPPLADNLYIAVDGVLRRRYEGTPERKGKILKNPDRDAFRLKSIHSFRHSERQTIVLFINAYNSLSVQRLMEDNENVERIYVVLNSLVEFPIVYTFEKPFKLLLFNDVPKDSADCSFRPVYSTLNKRTAVADANDAPGRSNRGNGGGGDDYVLIDTDEIVNDAPRDIRPDGVYVFDFSKVRTLVNKNPKIYRLFKMFYYTYCFNGARWSLHPDNMRAAVVYAFRRYFDDEMLIVSKWWPNDRTIDSVYSKLRRWCPEIFGTITDWFFQCDVRALLLAGNAAAAAADDDEVRLPNARSRTVTPGGHVWQPATLALMSLGRIGIGTVSYFNADPSKEDRGKTDVVGYYKHLLDIEYDTRF